MHRAMPVALSKAREPSLVAWRRIVAALDAQRDPRGLEADLAAVEAACAGWPDKQRLAPGRWLHALFEGNAEPRLGIARAVDITLHGAHWKGDRFAWTDAPALAEVTILRVLDDQLGDEGLARWIASSSHQGITELALGAAITDRGALRLSNEPRLGRLRSLSLFRNAIGPEGLGALIRSPHMGRALRRLLLGRNLFGEPGARALAGPTALANLDLLDLDCNRLDGPSIRALAGAPLLSGVRALNLSNNPIGAEGCAALSACPSFGDLEELFLHGCELDDDAIAGLLGAPWLPRIKNLALSDNALSMATVERLAARRELGLDELDICHNRFVTTDAARVLGGAPQFARLRRLCL